MKRILVATVLVVSFLSLGCISQAITEGATQTTCVLDKYQEADPNLTTEQRALRHEVNRKHRKLTKAPEVCPTNVGM